MKTINIGNKIEACAIALGCMRISSMSVPAIEKLVGAALDGGIDFFDHADIYGGGESESLFSRAVKNAGIPRDKMLIQTKCGIRDGMFDFSEEHIITSLEKSLKRLDMDYVDVFLLHRPDTLMEPEEVAGAFGKLHKSGKVRAFGVSNHNSGQIRLLGKYLKDELAITVNQLQFSPTNTGMIDSGLNVNMENPPSVDHDGSILEFCRYEDIVIQAWSPFQYGFFEGVFLGSDKYPKLNDVINDLAAQKNITPEAVVIAWILRHPAKMQAIPGSTNIERVKGICAALSCDISRREWYDIYCAAGNVLP
ncbi:MAG: aldo/keto reductase [Oscillospiraceae bacterium]|jgi:predicted oxidoreductase|nr:aldo/keto reductase [Oscillospiraceae bacterium]